MLKVASIFLGGVALLGVIAGVVGYRNHVRHQEVIAADMPVPPLRASSGELQAQAAAPEPTAVAQPAPSESETLKKQATAAAESARQKFTEIKARWKDAEILAGSTSRIALSGPVANLQAIKRELDATTMPECLSQAKSRLSESMEQRIAGFLAFMGETSGIGEAVARVKWDLAKSQLEEHEQYLSTVRCE